MPCIMAHACDHNNDVDRILAIHSKSNDSMPSIRCSACHTSSGHGGRSSHHLTLLSPTRFREQQTVRARRSKSILGWRLAVISTANGACDSLLEQRSIATTIAAIECLGRGARVARSVYSRPRRLKGARWQCFACCDASAAAAGLQAMLALWSVELQHDVGVDRLGDERVETLSKVLDAIHGIDRLGLEQQRAGLVDDEEALGVAPEGPHEAIVDRVDHHVRLVVVLAHEAVRSVDALLRGARRLDCNVLSEWPTILWVCLWCVCERERGWRVSDREGYQVSEEADERVTIPSMYTTRKCTWSR